jgi:hypothetical protein
MRYIREALRNAVRLLAMRRPEPQRQNPRQERVMYSQGAQEAGAGGCQRPAHGGADRT